MKDATEKKGKKMYLTELDIYIYVLELPSFMKCNLLFINSLDIIALIFFSEI